MFDNRPHLQAFYQMLAEQVLAQLWIVPSDTLPIGVCVWGSTMPAMFPLFTCQWQSSAPLAQTGMPTALGAN